MGYLPQKWRMVWEQLDREQLIRQMSLNTQVGRSHGRTVHKRSTIGEIPPQFSLAKFARKVRKATAHISVHNAKLLLCGN